MNQTKSWNLGKSQNCSSPQSFDDLRVGFFCNQYSNSVLFYLVELDFFKRDVMTTKQVTLSTGDAKSTLVCDSAVRQPLTNSLFVACSSMNSDTQTLSIFEVDFVKETVSAPLTVQQSLDIAIVAPLRTRLVQVLDQKTNKNFTSLAVMNAAPIANLKSQLFVRLFSFSKNNDTSYSFSDLGVVDFNANFQRKHIIDYQHYHDPRNSYNVLMFADSTTDQTKNIQLVICHVILQSTGFLAPTDCDTQAFDTGFSQNSTMYAFQTLHQRALIHSVQNKTSQLVRTCEISTYPKRPINKWNYFQNCKDQVFETPVMPDNLVPLRLDANRLTSLMQFSYNGQSFNTSEFAYLNFATGKADVNFKSS
jgi:hypothetical protein